MSWMKKRLIIASKSMFRVTSSNADELNQTLIWKCDALDITYKGC